MNTLRKHLMPFATLAATVGLALPAAAVAGSTSPTAGVHIDPASPVAKEYALPLATARGAPADTGSSGSLFGSGITRGGRTHTSPDAGRPAATAPAEHLPAETRQQSQPSTEQPPATAEQPPVTTDRQAPPAAAQPSSPATDAPPSSAPAVTSTVAGTTTTTATTTGNARTNTAGVVHRQHPPDSTTPAPRHRSQPTAHTGGHPAAISTSGTAPAASTVLEPSSGSGWLWMVLVALLVLLLGTGGAFLVVRTRQREVDPRPH